MCFNFDIRKLENYNGKQTLLLALICMLFLCVGSTFLNAQHIERTDTIYFSPENQIGAKIIYEDRKKIGFLHDEVEYRLKKKTLHNIQYADGNYLHHPGEASSRATHKEKLSEVSEKNLIMINTLSLLFNQIDIRYERFFADGAFSINPYFMRNFPQRIFSMGLVRMETSKAGLALNYYPLKKGSVRPYVFISGEYVVEQNPYTHLIDMAFYIGNGFNFQLTSSINLSTSLGLGRAFVFETNRNGFYLNGQLSIGYRF